MSTKKEFYYPSADGKTKIRAVAHIPEKTPESILQISHGMVEFIDRYDDFATYLAEKKILVVGNEHLGHGGSVLSKDKYGYFAEKNGKNIVLSDLYQLTVIMKEEYPSLPYFLLGHSMGSFFARQYLCTYGSQLNGAIIMGTGRHCLAETIAGKMLTSLIAFFKGWDYRSQWIDRLAFGGYNKRFQPERTSKDWLTKDEKIVDAYLHDERCGFIFTLNAYHTLFALLTDLCKKKNLNKMPSDLPIFFVAGEDDPVGNFGKSVRQVQKSFVKLGMTDTEIKLYPTDRHEILNETDQQTVYADLYSWISLHLK